MSESQQPAPEPSNNTDLELLKKQILALGVGNCDNGTLRQAQKITEEEYKGRPQDVYKLLPQLANDVLYAKELQDAGTTGKYSFLDINRNGSVDIPELTAAVVAAARIAQQRHLKLEEVPIAEIGKLVPEICEKLQGKGDPSCRPDTKVPRR